MKNKTKPSHYKIYVTIILFLLLFFGAINLIWYTSVKIPYDQYVKAFSNSDFIESSQQHSSDKYSKIIGEYKYTVARPEYLDFSGYLSVSYSEPPKVELDPETFKVVGSNGLYISVYIWPDIFGDYKYGVMFDDEYQNIFEQITISDNVTYLPDEKGTNISETAQRLLDDNRIEIKDMLHNAVELWKLY